ncbi:2855_t:CDS:1 [Ambispora gerdemannii]|uniref:2855_t:CDS:1 n=1 Tax=Ambispora gerdemannii TaxID=144530 RepID=A0A9N9DZ97_9GLOM|nr:2855_t:CDS:1 [Ambispora gerdemannii]
MPPLATAQTIQDHPYHKTTSNDEQSMCNSHNLNSSSEPKTLYATVKFSDDLTIDILVPTLKELLEIKTENSSLQKSLVNDQIDESAFGLFRLAFENEVYKKRIPTKLWGKFAAVGKEAWGNANGIYRDAFVKLVELIFHDE